MYVSFVFATLTWSVWIKLLLSRNICVSLIQQLAIQGVFKKSFFLIEPRRDSGILVSILLDKSIIRPIFFGSIYNIVSLLMYNEHRYWMQSSTRYKFSDILTRLSPNCYDVTFDVSTPDLACNMDNGSRSYPCVLPFVEKEERRRNLITCLFCLQRPLLRTTVKTLRRQKL